MSQENMFLRGTDMSIYNSLVEETIAVSQKEASLRQEFEDFVFKLVKGFSLYIGAPENKVNLVKNSSERVKEIISLYQAEEAISLTDDFSCEFQLVILYDRGGIQDLILDVIPLKVTKVGTCYYKLIVNGKGESSIKTDINFNRIVYDCICAQVSEQKRRIAEQLDRLLTAEKYARGDTNAD
ncbi:hypothetical protein [Dendrosporobacter sp. 1207_IL3150]|uniref:hypothetical protein n=1 Tax=Dendrosporobacter sp. 1207_IL3150 TaxID=3084054 RepID=UPI002FDB2479